MSWCVCVCVCVWGGGGAGRPGCTLSWGLTIWVYWPAAPWFQKPAEEKEEWREWFSILTGRFLSVAALCLFRSTAFLGENVSHESQNGTWILTKATSKVRKRLGLYTTVSVWMCVWGMLTQSINDSTGQGSTRGSVTALPALLVWGRNLISLGVRPAHVLGTRLGIDSGL